MPSFLKYIFFISVLLLSIESSLAQGDIDAMEYFIDSGDLGVGLNTAVPITGGANISESFIVPTSALSPGFHTVYFRVRDLGGQWSIQNSRNFFISPSNLTTQANISNVEYFIDTDPGYGAGISLGAFSTSTVSINTTLPTSALSTGFHVLFIRALDNDGIWGSLEFRPFFISESDLSTTANIVELRYYIDSDPGYGNGSLIPITTSTTIDVSPTLSTSALSAGYHVLHIRSLDSDGLWSEIASRSFYVDAYSSGLITGVEYFYDTDPGYGAGSNFAIAPAVASIDQVIDLPTTALTAGTHEVGLRMVTDNGVIGMTDYYTFNLCATALADFTVATACTGQVTTFTDISTGVVGGDVYSWDFDGDTVEDDNTAGNTSFTYPGSGTFTATLSIDRAGCISTAAVTVVVENIPTADFTTSTACLGLTTDFTDLSTGTLAGDVYSWDFDGDNVEDDNTAGNTTFIYPTTGTFTASLIVDRNGCNSTATVSVTVEGTPTSNAGVDQDICVDNTVLTATPANAGETGVWSIISGTGTISSVNDPTATFSGITTFDNQIRWTVTNDAAGCADFDDVIIQSNQPISVTPSSNVVSLGQTINTNVQSTAIINPGDALTTAIITPPTKGTATLLANGTIDYSPTNGTVGTDTVRFQLCNQCNNCVNSYLAIDIQNNAPIITPGSLSVDPGGKVSLDLLAIISDANNNLDPSSLRIVEQPISGALAAIDASFILTIDYSGIVFVGTDQLSIEACDLAGACATSVIFIEVNLPGDPPVTVYNAVSPNGDEKHDFLEIENIDFYEGNRLIIFNRWGKKVFEVSGYDNDVVKFSGIGNTGGAKELPSGTYYYQLDLGNGSESNGYFVLKN